MSRPLTDKQMLERLVDAYGKLIDQMADLKRMIDIVSMEVAEVRRRLGEQDALRSVVDN